MRHGLLANILLMKDESSDVFEDHLKQLVDRLQPADDVELGMVEEIAAASWRMRRAWAFETRMLDNATAAGSAGSAGGLGPQTGLAAGDLGPQAESDQLDRMTAAFATLANSPALGLIHRYETRLHLMYQRSLHNLLLLRVSEVPNEPSPNSEHLLDVTPGTPPPEEPPDESEPAA